MWRINHGFWHDVHAITEVTDSVIGEGSHGLAFTSLKCGHHLLNESAYIIMKTDTVIEVKITL